MLSREDLVALGKVLASADMNAPVAYSFKQDKFSYQELNETFRKELNELGNTNAKFRENKNTIFALMEEILDDVLPKKVMQQYMDFAEVTQSPQGVKPVFIQKITEASKRRAKQFVTKVGLAGVYEVFKLDGRRLEIPTTAYGGAAQIGFEEFLDGRIQMSDVLDIVMEGLDEAIYKEIEMALRAALTELPQANKTSQTDFDEKEMDRLISIADSYGRSVIYCTYEFAATIVPSDGWVSSDMKNEKWQKGYLGNYKGHRVIVFDQSYEDETNEKKVIDPSIAYIIPSGTARPVKIGFEGQTAVKDVDNADWSKEIQVYKKLGVGTIITNNICAYENTSLKA